METGLRDIGDPSEDVAKPGKGIDVIEARGAEQCLKVIAQTEQGLGIRNRPS